MIAVRTWIYISCILVLSAVSVLALDATRFILRKRKREGKSKMRDAARKAVRHVRLYAEQVVSTAEPEEVA